MVRLLLSSCFFSLAINSIIAQQFNFQNFSVQEGLAQSQVYALLEDSRGYIWMGTRGGGLSCFDGESFQNYTVQEGLINNYIGALLEDKEHNIWIGTNNGLCKYNGLVFQNHIVDPTQTIAVTSLFQDYENQIWVGTNKGLFTFNGKHFEAFSQNESLSKRPVYCIFQDSKQVLWIGTNRGLFKIKKDKIQRFSIQEGLPSTDVRSVTESANGSIWIANFSGGISIYENNELRPFDEFQNNKDFKNPLILDMYTGSKNEIWVSTQNRGIAIWNPIDSLATYFTENDGLSNNHVRSVTEDTWGNIWIATSGGGCSKYSGQQFVHYNRSTGFRDGAVYAICKDTLDQFWLSASTKGVSVYTDSTLTHLGRDSGFYNIKTKALFQDKQGRIWLGTDGKGLAVYDTLGFTFFNAEDGLGGNFVHDILQDSLDNIWVATTDGGITRMQPIEDTIPHRYDFRFYTRDDGLPHHHINDIHLDRNNRLWYASASKGIGYLSNGKITTIQKKDGLVSNYTRSLVEDSTGYLWVGSADAGVCKIPIYTDSIQVQVSEQQLTSNNIYLLLLDDEQNLWAGSEDGLDKITLDAERNIKTIKAFGKSEGFLGVETCKNAALKDAQGNLWFGTMKGLTKYNPSYSTKNTIPPKVRITDIRLFYKSLTETDYKDWITDWNTLQSGLVLPHQQNHLEFEFLGVNHPNPTKVRYQWKLEGSETDWSPPSSRQSATYSNLAPGDYTFLLKAYNEDGISAEKPLQISFAIKPPFWQLWWFRAACIVALILLIGGIIQSRVNRIRRKAKREQAQLELENNLLQLKQKALQLQMNPHFIFNALNSIQNLIVQKDHQTARYQLAKFSKLMRAILENSRDNAISLEREIETLSNYIAIEKLSNGDDFQHDIQVETTIDQEEIFIPPMMIQPFVENAIIHGIAPLREKGKLQISFSQHQKSIQCIIQDNGIGFEQAQKAKAVALGVAHKSAALQVTQERLDILHKNPTQVASLDIQEIVLKNGQVGGTKVVLRVPILEESVLNINLKSPSLVKSNHS